MAWLQAIFFLLLGLGLLLVDFQSLRRGWLPCGPNGLQGRLEFHRDRQPIRYWLMFLVYGGAGIALVLFALRLLMGAAEPLPLR
ncbi:MAG: hypothetical protein ACK4E7_10835 [Permianibacter sp.]